MGRRSRDQYSRYSTLPPMGPGGDVLLVEPGEAPFEDTRLAGDPHVGDMLAASGIDQVRDRIKAREGLERRKFNGGEAGGFAPDHRSDLGFQADGARGVARGPRYRV